jgi:hypothetical protein
LIWIGISFLFINIINFRREKETFCEFNRLIYSARLIDLVIIVTQFSSSFLCGINTYANVEFYYPLNACSLFTVSVCDEDAHLAGKSGRRKKGIYEGMVICKRKVVIQFLGIFLFCGIFIMDENLYCPDITVPLRY